MPYIISTDRPFVTPRSARHALKAGDLNFQITELIKTYIDFHGYDYTTFNAVVGALECAKLEFYRRVMVPYEDNKIQENGDVY